MACNISTEETVAAVAATCGRVDALANVADVGAGSVVNVASESGLRGSAAVAASKHAVVGRTRN